MTFLEEISQDIDWRTSEMASLRSIPLRYNLSQEHQELLFKYSVPSIYALWEGFVKSSFKIYIRVLNQLNLSTTDTHLNLLTHALSTFDKLSLENPRMSFRAKKEFIEFYQNSISAPLNIGLKIPTRSNIDFKTINEILERFNLDVLPQQYETLLNKLVFFRNTVAHGDNSLPISIDNLNDFYSLLGNLMVEIFERVERGFTSQSFKCL